MRASQMLEEDDLNESNFISNNGNKSASMFSGFSPSGQTVRSNLESRHRNDLKKMEKERKDQFEKMKREHEAIENDFNTMKEKFEAIKARNTVLANENKTVKEQVKTLLDKGKHDDELIEALMVYFFRIFNKKFKKKTVLNIFLKLEKTKSIKRNT